MEPISEKIGRHSIRLKGYDYTGAGGYYVTIVTFRRELLFGEILDGVMQVNALGRIVQECWDDIPLHFPNTTVDIFRLMPNHAHGIFFIHETPAAGEVGPIPVEAVGPVPVGARYISPLPEPQRPLSPQSPLYPQSPLPPRLQSPQSEQRPNGFKQGSVGAIVGSFKAAVTRRAGRELNSGNIWQRNYYEHILRNQADYERIAGYILDNPLHWAEDGENPLHQPDP